MRLYPHFIGVSLLKEEGCDKEVLVEEQLDQFVWLLWWFRWHAELKHSNPRLTRSIPPTEHIQARDKRAVNADSAANI
jgi:hypothetical protein